MSLTVVLICGVGGDGYGSGGYLRRRSQERGGLTTKADHNSIGIRPTLSEDSSGQIPGSRCQPTSRTYLTSE